MHPREWNVTELLEMSAYFWRTCALHAAVKLGIFSELGSNSLMSEQVARQVNGSADGVERLLNALAAMQLIEKRQDRFTCPPSTRRLLAKDSPAYVGHIIMHHHHLLESWARLDRSVLSGFPDREQSSFAREEWRESFLMGMFNMAMALAPRIAETLDLSSRRRLLDLGGGPGTYAIHFCQRNPELQATVFDLETTRPFAEKTITRFNLNDRITFAPGDYHEDDIPGLYDVAWLSHILHAEGPEACRNIIRKAASVLENGGMVIIHEFILNDSMDGPLFPALFSLNMLLGTSSGRSYSQQQLTDMLKAAGARDVHRIPLETPNDSGLIVGRF